MSTRLAVLAADIAPRRGRIQAERPRSGGDRGRQGAARGQVPGRHVASVGPWLQANVSMSERTARRYMQLARADLEHGNADHGPVRGVTRRSVQNRTRPTPQHGGRMKRRRRSGKPTFLSLDMPAPTGRSFRLSVTQPRERPWMSQAGFETSALNDTRRHSARMTSTPKYCLL